MAYFDLDLDKILPPGDFVDTPYSHPGSQIAHNKKYRAHLVGWVDTLPKVKKHLEALPTGVAVHSAELEKLYTTSGASVRKCVNELINYGIPVCSNENGYYLPKNKSQVLKGIQHLESRRDSIDARVKRLYEYMKNLPDDSGAETDSVEVLQDDLFELADKE